jgi:hypothetical protein
MDKGWRKVPILTYMIRDGMAEFLVISCEDSQNSRECKTLTTDATALLLITMLYDTFRQEVASVVFS